MRPHGAAQICSIAALIALKSLRTIKRLVFEIKRLVFLGRG